MPHPAITLTAPAGAAGAPLLVLGHTLGTTPEIWRDVVPLLTDAYRVTCAAFPGHGDAPTPAEPFTMAELAAAVADGVRGLGEERALYAGVSLGGAVALRLALDHADLFAAVAAMGSGAELGGPGITVAEHWGQRAEAVRLSGTASLVDATAPKWFAPATRAERPELVAATLRQLGETSDAGYIACAGALGTHDLRDRLGEIAVPVLAVWGEHDPIGTEGRQRAIVAGAPRGRIARIDGAAHQMTVERPAACAAALCDFFSDTLR